MNLCIYIPSGIQKILIKLRLPNWQTNFHTTGTRQRMTYWSYRQVLNGLLAFATTEHYFLYWHKGNQWITPGHCFWFCWGSSGSLSSETLSSRGLDSNSRPLFSLPEKQKSGVVDIFDWSKLFENFSRFKNGHFKCIQLETTTIVFEDFTLKSMILENFSTVFYKGLCKGRLENSLFFMAQNGEFGSIVPCVSVTLLSLKCCIKSHT